MRTRVFSNLQFATADFSELGEEEAGVLFDSEVDESAPNWQGEEFSSVKNHP